MRTVKEIFHFFSVLNVTTVYLHAPLPVGVIKGPLSYPYFTDYFLYKVDSFFWSSSGDLHIFVCNSVR